MATKKETEEGTGPFKGKDTIVDTTEEVPEEGEQEAPKAPTDEDVAKAAELRAEADAKMAEANQAAFAAQGASIGVAGTRKEFSQEDAEADLPKAPKGVDQETFEAALAAAKRARLDGTGMDQSWNLTLGNNPALAEAVAEASREPLAK